LTDTVLRAHEEMKHLIALKYMVESALKQTMKMIPPEFQEGLHPLMDPAVDHAIETGQMEYVMMQFIADNRDRVEKNFSVVLKKMQDHFDRYIAKVAVGQEVSEP
jgi:hypothetical protein